MNFLVFPLGSAGDVHPLLGLACALQARGHEVTAFTCGYFRELVERVGVPFVELGTRAEYLEAIADPQLWHPVRGFGVVFDRVIGRALRPQYRLIAERFSPGKTVVIANHLGLGARLAQEKLGVPLITVHGAPACIWSEYESPALSPLIAGRYTPRWLKRILYRIGEYVVVDRTACPEINRFRAELGLAPMRRTTRWWHSPECVLCLFPAWYGPAQPDWPPNVFLAQFPLWDEGTVTAPQPEVEEFLAAGSPPLVFTPGSANKYADYFFAAAVDACQRLNQRGLLLTRFPDQVPASLPPGVRRFDYVPFGRLLARSAALVHHGGFGTVAQGLRAGIPQLLMPLSHDQPDNASRLRKLGVGDALAPSAFRGPAVAKALERLLTSTEVARRCKEVAARFVGVSPLGEACDVVERFASG